MSTALKVSLVTVNLSDGFKDEIKEQFLREISYFGNSQEGFIYHNPDKSIWCEEIIYRDMVENEWIKVMVKDFFEEDFLMYFGEWGTSNNPLDVFTKISHEYEGEMKKAVESVSFENMSYQNFLSSWKNLYPNSYKEFMEKEKKIAKSKLKFKDNIEIETIF